MARGDHTAYVLGHSDRELERLRRQANLVDPITRQFLIEAGVASGMHVLDIGSGAGDVAFLAAQLVGASGRVVGVDRSAAALARARSRASELSLGNVTFRESELSAMAFDQLESKPFRFFPRQSGAIRSDLTFRIVNRQHSTDLWQHLLENLQTLCREVLHRIMNPG